MDKTNKVMPESEPKRSSLARNSAIIGSAILGSRLAGVIRESVFAHYFGSSDAADVFRAAQRIPNLLQNLFGEGALSAAFIPVYVKLRANKEDREADELASAIFCLLALAMSCLVLVGIFATPLLIDLIAPGFTGAKLELAIRLVRVLFPAVGLLVMSAWCLGILNSHRRFFVSYTAPIVLNLAMIVTLFVFGRRLDQTSLATALAWGYVGGSALQFGVQLPQIKRFIGKLTLILGLGMKSVRSVIRSFGPVLISRGVVQISAYVDTLIASFLPTGALAQIGYAQLLYMLPISLFGMSVSQAELPTLSEMSTDNNEATEHLRTRLNAGFRQIAFFVVFFAVMFFALGDVIVAAIYQTGRFTHADSVYVWAILGGYGIGLLANTMGRLYSSMYWALHDTRTPLYYATARVVLSGALGYLVALHGPPLLGIDQRWGVAGLAAASGVSGWLEFALLRHSLRNRIGRTGLPASFTTRLWFAAAISAAAAWAARSIVRGYQPIIVATVVLGLYGILYLAMSYLLKIGEAKAMVARAFRVVRRSK